MPWLMGAVCSATACAVELSDSTLAAMAALIGAATLALTSGMASRSGSSETACSSSSSLLSWRSGCFWLRAMRYLLVGIALVGGHTHLVRVVSRHPRTGPSQPFGRV